MNSLSNDKVAIGHTTNSWAGVSRTRAALIHLVTSVVVAIALVALMLFVWYPPPYFEAMGGGLLLALIVGIDMIVGPLITFIIFDTKKKSIKFDLAVVVVLQVAAFVYGASVMFAARPVYTVYSTDRFEVVTPSRIPPDELGNVTRESFKRIPLGGPVIVASRIPEPMENTRIMFHPTAGGDLVAFPQHYVPYEEEAKRAGSSSKPLADLRQKDPKATAGLDNFIRQHALDERKLGYLPVNTKANDMAAILDRETGKLYGFIFANPW